jgi:hypothetical protein
LFELHAEISASRRWTGGTAMAAWGRTDEISANGTLGWDATAGDFPWRTTVTGNLITETGIWEKQSSCWFQAKAAQSTLTGNVCFNLARAGFNFNDGLGGGDEVHSNLIFNSCRESADHVGEGKREDIPCLCSLYLALADCRDLSTHGIASRS